MKLNKIYEHNCKFKYMRNFCIFTNSIIFSDLSIYFYHYNSVLYGTNFKRYIINTNDYNEPIAHY